MYNYSIPTAVHMRPMVMPQLAKYRFALPVSTHLVSELNDYLKQVDDVCLIESQAVIPIAKFEATDRMEDTLIRWTQRICMQQPTLPIAFNNFGAFPPNQVYLRVQDAAMIKKLVGKLRAVDTYLSGYDHPPLESVNRICMPLFPQLTTMEAYEMAQKIARCEFNATTHVSQLCLQKLKGQQWQTIQSFSLATGD